MSGIDVRPVHRVKGRPALVRRLRGLLLAVHRFGRCRAATDADRRWTAAVLDALAAALAVADTDQRGDFCPCCASLFRATDDARPPGGRSTTTGDRPACGSTDTHSARCVARGADGAAIARHTGTAGVRGCCIAGIGALEHRAGLKFSVRQQNDFRPGGRK